MRQESDDHFFLFFQVTAKAGETVKLGVQVKGVPKPDVKWMRGKVALYHGKMNFKMSKGEDGWHYIEVKKLANTDGGTFIATAFNLVGEAKSENDLIVHYAPTVKKGLAQVELVRDKPCKLEAVFDANPPAEVEWFKDDQPLVLDGRVQTKWIKHERKFVMNISKSVPEDTGVYKAVATNYVGSAETECFLGVNIPPRFTKKLAENYTKENDEHVLEVSVEGFPIPTITWKKNNGEEDVDVVFDDRIKQELSEDTKTGRLIFKKALLSDVAMYKAYATNSVGKVITEGKMFLMIIPTFSKPLEAAEVLMGELGTMSVTVRSLPKADIKWFKDDKELKFVTNMKFYSEKVADSDTDTKYWFDIAQVAPEDLGTFSVKATNPVGEAKTSAKLAVSVPPKFHPWESLKLPVDCTATAVCKLDGVPKPTLEW